MIKVCFRTFDFNIPILSFKKTRETFDRFIKLQENGIEEAKHNPKLNFYLAKRPETPTI